MGQQRILITDEDAKSSGAISSELEKAGYAVVLAHDSAEAMDCIRLSEFDLILLGIGSRGADGFEMLREICNIRHEVPVIAMLAHTSRDAAAKAITMGAVTCVCKSYGMEALLALVKTTLDAYKALANADSTQMGLFAKGHIVLLEVLDGDRPGSYQTAIEGQDDKTLIVTCLSRAGGPILEPGIQVSLGIACQDALYSFESTVLARCDEDSAAVVIGKPSVIYRIQRRLYPRMRIKASIAVSLIDKELLDREVGPAFRARTEDVSAGGVRIIMDGELPESADVSVRASGGNGLPHFTGRGRVIRSRQMRVNGLPYWEYAIQFTRIDEDAKCALQEAVETSGVW